MNLNIRMITFTFTMMFASNSFAGSAKEKTKQKAAEDFANGRTDCLVGSESCKGVHRQLLESCGHDIKVTFDWDSYKNPALPAKIGDDASNVAYWCIQEFLGDVAYTCTLSADYKAAIAKVKTLTFHYKNCKDLPLANPEYPAGGPGYEYSLSKDGTTLNKSWCEKSFTYSGRGPREWLANAF
jgi:hypothetical protein